MTYSCAEGAKKIKYLQTNINFSKYPGALTKFQEFPGPGTEFLKFQEFPGTLRTLLKNSKKTAIVALTPRKAIIESCMIESYSLALLHTRANKFACALVSKVKSKTCVWQS